MASLGLSLFFERAKKFQGFLGPQVWSMFLQAIVVGLFLFVIEASFVLVFQGFLLAVGLIDESKVSLPRWYPTSLAWALTALTIFGILRGCAYLLKTYLAGATTQAFIKHQQTSVLGYALEHAHEVSSHEVITVFTERIPWAGQALVWMSQSVITLTSCLLFLLLGLRLAPIETFLGIGLLAVFVLPLKFMNARIREYAHVLLVEAETQNRTLLQGIKNNFFLRVHGLIPQEIERGSRAIANHVRHRNKYYFIFSCKSTAPLVVGILIISLITFCSVTFVKTPSVKLIAFFYIFIRLSQGASELSSSLSELRLQLPGFKQLYAWHVRILVHYVRKKTLAPQRNAALEAAILASIRESGIRIELAGVGFTYDGSNFLFRNLTLAVAPGKPLLIRGESGAGKSSLLTLILGINHPTEGRVLINGYAVSDVLDLLRDRIAYVGPEPYLIPGTVRENLLYGYREPQRLDDTAIWEALKRAQLLEDVRALPGQLETQLLEFTQLSTGQKQRLAIARAILRNPSLLLLDEASANLDSQTEASFIASLRSLLTDVTTVIISHKDSFNPVAAQIITLSKTPARELHV